MTRVQSTAGTRSALGFLVLVPLTLGAALLAGAGRGPLAGAATPDPSAAPASSDPTSAPVPARAQLDAAAGMIEATTDADGTGYRFEIVQTSTLHALPDGPRIEVPDPTDPHATLGFADAYQIDTAIEHGVVTPNGFWMEMRSGPTADKAPDFEKAPYRFGTLVKDGITYRNDGDGWYETDRPPGIGLDPATAALLPTLLREATKPKDAGTASADAADAGGTELRLVTATGDVADIPGVIAVDGEPFTELTEPVEFGFDDQGRLAKLRVVARNTNHKVFDLIVETVITFDWTVPPGPLPDPVPSWTAGGKG
jgi:hypothetical protein